MACIASGLTSSTTGPCKPPWTLACTGTDSIRLPGSCSVPWWAYRPVLLSASFVLLEGMLSTTKCFLYSVRRLVVRFHRPTKRRDDGRDLPLPGPASLAWPRLSPLVLVLVVLALSATLTASCNEACIGAAKASHGQASGWPHEIDDTGSCSSHVPERIGE